MGAFLSIQRQRTTDAIRRWFADPANPIIGAADRSRLGQLHSLDFGADDASVDRLGERLATSVANVTRKDAFGTEGCAVVAARYGGYRAAFIAFIKAVYGVDPRDDLPSFRRKCHRCGLC